ncbi:helix-turn-helix domain-containing protein [Corynebacterium sp. sy017]|uniref:helix-turn-helix domain-containing protein n=1 Tax=unclassified Corynebacterium TaxID=2624378 RepID=UPI001186EA76|nr:MULTISPECIES: helix-turn-helix domain-containing protein [unclassified Corynebacterium]MBP3089101.1 helix-turn-helix domain-containing protein [Corynebacterium sp. sy017]TSD91415.1 helix-turn-helix domain-containing protein [Corynebacterium sp. SY003]
MSHVHNGSISGTTVTSREALRKLNSVLDSHPENKTIDVAVENSDETIRLPHEVAVVLREILVNSAAGIPVGVIPTHAELTTQQAADLLNVSRPYVVKLMDQGVLPGHKVGTHRRVYAADVQRYKHQRDIEQRISADQLTVLSDEMGLYE